VSSNTVLSISAIGSARLVKRRACSISTKPTASRTASSAPSRLVPLAAERLISCSCDSSWCCAADTFASGTFSSQTLALAASVNSGAASAAGSGKSSFFMTEL
jgi:hypothetical protein